MHYIKYEYTIVKQKNLQVCSVLFTSPYVAQQIHIPGDAMNT